MLGAVFLQRFPGFVVLLWYVFLRSFVLLDCHRVFVRADLHVWVYFSGWYKNWIGFSFFAYFFKCESVIMGFVSHWLVLSIVCQFGFTEVFLTIFLILPSAIDLFWVELEDLLSDLQDLKVFVSAFLYTFRCFSFNCWFLLLIWNRISRIYFPATRKRRSGWLANHFRVRRMKLERRAQQKKTSTICTNWRTRSVSRIRIWSNAIFKGTNLIFDRSGCYGFKRVRKSGWYLRYFQI